MRDRMLKTLIRVALCPGERIESEMCNLCEYRGTEACAAALRHEAVALLDDSSTQQVQRKTFDLELRITTVLHELGVPANLKGFGYLRYALLRAVAQPELVQYITGDLYPTVAKEFQTTPPRVERAIRHVIEVAWDRVDLDVMQAYFGNTISLSKCKPTNAEFIALVSDNLRLEMKRAAKL